MEVTGAYGTRPVGLRGDLGVWVDAIEFGQSVLVDLPQVLLQRQVSVREEPEEHTSVTSAPHLHLGGCVWGVLTCTWRYWGGSGLRGSV